MVSAYVETSRDVFNEYANLKSQETQLRKEYKDYGYRDDIVNDLIREQLENKFYDKVERVREEIQDIKETGTEKEIERAVYREIALNDLINVYKSDVVELNNIHDNIKRTIKEGKAIASAERVKKAKEFKEWRDKSKDDVIKAIGEKYSRIVNPVKSSSFTKKKYFALTNMLNMRTWLGEMGVELIGRTKKAGKRLLYGDVINETFYDNLVMKSENRQEKLLREHKKDIDELTKKYWGQSKVKRDKKAAEQKVVQNTGAYVITEGGKTIELKLTKNQAMGHLFMIKDPESQKAYYEPIKLTENGREIGNGFTEETVKALEKYVGEDNIKIVNELADRVSYWGEIADKEYINQYGVSMKTHEGYIPRSKKEIARIKQKIEIEYNRPTTKSGHIKERVDILGAHDNIDVFDLYNGYVKDMINYASFTETFRKFNSIFGDVKVNKGMRNRYGNTFANYWQWQLNNMVGNVDLNMHGVIDKLAQPFRKGALFFTLTVPAKQTISLMYWYTELNTRQSLSFSKDIPLIMFQAVGERAGKSPTTVNSMMYNYLRNSSFVKKRKESRGVELGSEYQFTEAAFKEIQNDGKFWDTYNKIKQGKISPYSRRVKEFNDKFGGILISMADNMPITIGGTGYFKQRFRQLSGKKLTINDINKAKKGNPSPAFKQALKDWESIAEQLQQSVRKSNQAKARMNNQFVRNLVMFTSAQHQLFLSRRYHRRAAERMFKAGDKAKAFKHIKAYSLLAVASPLIYSFFNNGFRLDDEEGDLYWDVGIGMLSAGIPFWHQFTEFTKAMATGKPWGEEFEATPLFGFVGEISNQANEIMKNTGDPSISNDEKKEDLLKFGSQVVRLAGINAPAVLRFYEGWSNIADTEFPLQSAIGMNTDYIKGKGLIDILKNYNDVSFKGETMVNFYDRLQHINSKRGESVRIDLNDPQIKENYKVIHTACQRANETNNAYWVVNFIKKFENTMYERPDKYVKNVDKVAWMADRAKKLNRSVTGLSQQLENYGYELTRHFKKRIKEYDRGNYDLTKESERDRLDKNAD